MKKILVFFIVTIMIVTGCSETNTQNDSQKKDELYFLFATPLYDHPIWQQSYKGFTDACDALDVKCDWLGPKVIDTEEMEKTINMGIMQNADGIITQGVVSTEILKKAHEKKIPLILVDANIKESEKIAFYGKDFEEQAQLLLAEIEKDLGKETYLNIAIQVAELKFDIAQDQIAKIKEVFSTHMGGYQISDISESKSDRVRAQTEWNRVLDENPDINITINLAAESASACVEAVAKTYHEDQVKIYAVDDIDTTIDYIREGKIDASIVTSFYQYGYNTLYLLYDYAENGKSPDNVDNNVSLLAVNKDNVDKYKEILQNEK